MPSDDVEVFRSEADYRRKLAALKASVTLGAVTPSRGRWKARYDRDHQTHRPGRTFPTEYEARLWLREEQRLIDSDRWTPPAERRAELAAADERDTKTFATYANEWISARVTPRGQPLHPRSVGEYRDYLDGILEPIASQPLTAITLAHMKAWHAKNGHRPSLRHHAYMWAKSVFKSAVADGLIAENPCHVENAAKKPPAKTDSGKLVRALTHEKVNELASLMLPRDRMLVLLVAYCCARPGEACGFRRGDVEIGTADGVPFGWLTVERGISLYDGQRHEGDVKTGDTGERIVPIPPHLVGDLQDHLTVWAEPAADGLLFPGTNPAIAFRTSSQIAGWPEVVAPDGRVRKRGSGWRHARNVAGVPTLRLYDLRHWGATLWDEAGTPEALRRAILGHVQPGMTGHYTHPDTAKASPYALRVSELAGWTPPTAATSAATTDASGTLAGILAAMDAPTLAATLGALDAGQLAEVIPLLPADRMAEAVALLAARRGRS